MRTRVDIKQQTIIKDNANRCKSVTLLPRVKIFTHLFIKGSTQPTFTMISGKACLLSSYMCKYIHSSQSGLLCHLWYTYSILVYWSSWRRICLLCVKRTTDAMAKSMYMAIYLNKTCMLI